MTFCEYYGINEQEVDFLNIRLDKDYPFFIDPLLVKHSKILKNAYYKIELYFTSENSTYIFPEIKQNHLGYSLGSCNGHGVGPQKGNKLKNNRIISNFGFESTSAMLKGFGIDLLSDITTNIIHQDLLIYTEAICNKYNVQTRPKKILVWNGTEYVPEFFNVPMFNNDYIILVPLEILCKKRNMINQQDIIKQLDSIVDVFDGNVKIKLIDMMMKNKKKKDKNGREIIYQVKKTKRELEKLFLDFIGLEPRIIEEYITRLDLENSYNNVSAEDASYITYIYSLIDEMKELFNNKNKALEKENITLQSFAEKMINVYKNELENSDAILKFNKNEMRSEKIHQDMFRLLTKDREYKVLPEVNSGNGPVDFLIYGQDNEIILIEFKLSKSSKLKNVVKQVEAYKLMHGNDVIHSYVIAISYDDNELKKAKRYQNENDNDEITWINIYCNADLYSSASNKIKN